jgi:Glycosyl hydrolase family 26
MVSTEGSERLRRRSLPHALAVLGLVVGTIFAVGAIPLCAALEGPRTFRLGLANEGGPTDIPQVAEFTQESGGRMPEIMLWYQDFRQPFNATALAAVPPSVTPVLTWEPFDSSRGAEQTEYRLNRIAAGEFDAYIAQWARDLAANGREVVLRFAHEPNGDWYPWSERVNGNAAGDYARAWRHVHDVFREAGTPNVKWMWSPNVEVEGSTPLTELWPGSDYVDLIGIDGYNWGTSQPGKRWQTPDEVFAATVNQVRQITDKPLIISEVASAEQGGDKAAWIDQFGHFLSANPQIEGFVWFDYNKEADWRVDSSPASRDAFQRLVSGLP